MKKTVFLAIILILTLIFSGCDIIEEKLPISDIINAIRDKNTDEPNGSDNTDNEVNAPENKVPDTAHTSHTYEPVVSHATCTESGLITYACTECDKSFKGEEIKPLGHSWLAATVESPKTCERCGITEGEKLPEGTVTPDVPTSYQTIYVTYINVGQGDSIFIRIDDCDILIDGGKSGAGATVSSYLKSIGVDDIELMINTHPDEDHFGGLNEVLKDFEVEEAWGSPYPKSTTGYKTFKSNVSAEGLTLITPEVGAVYSYEELTLTVLYNGTGATSSNDSSLVIMLEYGSFSFLFTGDISNKIESKLVSSGVDLSCDVLKVAHHGSKSSSSLEFLKATGAKYSVICVGQNSYGHPTSSALNNLASAGMVIYRTDKDGNVEFSTNGSEMTLPQNDGIVTVSEYSSRNIKPEIEAQIYTIRKLKYSFCLLNSISCCF